MVGNVSIEHISRRGQTWYLHVKTTPKGRPNYFFSMAADGQLAPALPQGYEIYENVGGQVFLRKTTAQIIRPEELASVESALRKHGDAWRYQTEIKKNAITVHQAGDMAGLDSLAQGFGRPRLSADEKLRSASYMAVLRFVLVDKRARCFATERFCFRGSVDDWIPVGGPGTLAAQVRQFVKHLGRESFYELF
jgi:hypothetical protein